MACRWIQQTQPSQKIWLAEMEGQGCGRYNKAKRYLEEVLEEPNFQGDTSLLSKYYWLWYKSDESKEDLLTQITRRRKEFEDLTSFGLEFNLLCAYRKYDDLIALCYQAIPKISQDSKHEVIYALTEVIGLNSPERYEEITSLFTDDLINSNLPVEKKIRLSNFFAQAGHLQLGIKLLYNEINISNSSSAKQYYVGLWGLYSDTCKFDDEDFKSLNIVSADCLVQLTSPKSEKQLKIVVSPSNQEKKELQELLVGKFAGETFEYQRSIGTKVSYVITNIYGKYLGLHLQILEEIANDPISDIALESIHFNPDDLQRTLEDMMDVAGGKEKIQEDNNHRASLFASFDRRELSFTELVNSLDAEKPIEIYKELTIGSFQKFPCLFASQDTDRIPTYYKLVVDFTTLIPLFNLHQKFGILPVNQLVCSQTIVDFIRKKIYELSKDASASGVMYFTNSGPRFITYPQGYHERILQDYKDLLSWIENYCLVEFSYRAGDFIIQLQMEKKELKERLPNIETIINNIVLSENEGYLLLTDDVFYWKFFEKGFVSLQSIFHQKLFTGNATKEQLLYYLLENSYIGIRPDKDLLLETVIRGDVMEDSKPLFNLLEGSVIYEGHGLMKLLSFVREVYIDPNFSDPKREQVARIILGFVFNHLPNPTVKLKDKLFMKLSIDFRLLPKQFDSVKKVFEQEWKIKYPLL